MPPWWIKLHMTKETFLSGIALLFRYHLCGL
ncbi:hypothetical protein M8C21_020512 [Ambrosia artemisiifolia]|uniref:Uncharacterized protein n=1 Tax=Ambrosia artemisiifolia TaxID=4212 RepID=A0AAD5GQ12_AMBAR|nr:hypothetical protein M8C21_020512 [Ambrosia artemisiifolia]